MNTNIVILSNSHLLLFVFVEKQAVLHTEEDQANNHVNLHRFTRSVASSTHLNKSANLKKVVEEVLTSSFKKFCHGR